MNKYYLDRALDTAREMIKAYCVDRNVEGVFKHVSAESFNFVGFMENVSFNSKEDFRKYAEDSLPYTLNYNVVDEDYSIVGQSQDSCLVLAKITYMHSNTKKTLVLNYFFYFNLQGDKIICTHYHVNRQFNINKAVWLVFLNENMPYPKLPSEIQDYSEAKKIFQKKKIADSIHADFGIHISQNIVIYPRSRKLKIEGDTIELTPIECEIFLVLADNLNQPISAEKIYEIIWLKSELQLTSNALPMHISNVRRKLAPYEHLIKLPHIKNEGYCLAISNA